MASGREPVSPFREGFQSGIIRTVWGQDGSMIVGMTSRGWAATGKDPYGIQRLVWTGKTPFEMKTITSKPDGFEVAFTLPVDRKTAENPDNYSLNSSLTCTIEPTAALSSIPAPYPSVVW